MGHKKFIPNGDTNFVTMAENFARQIVADPAVHDAVIARVTEAAAACGLVRLAMAPSTITGATGNQEFFLHLRGAG